MAGVSLRVAAWARANWRRTIPVVLIVALAAATAFALSAGTRRAESAPDRLTAALGGDPDLALYQTFGPPLTDAIRGVDGVAFASGLTFVAAFPVGDDGTVAFDANPFAGDDAFFGAQLVEGRFTDPANPSEFTANREAAELFGGEVGRTYDVVSYSQEQIERSEFGGDTPFLGPRSRSTLVGITSSPMEFNDPTPQIVYSHAYLSEFVAAGVVASIIGVRVEPGVDPAGVLESIRDDARDVELFEIEPRMVTQGARDAVGVFTRSYWIVTLVTALAAALIVAQLVTRHLRSAPGEREPLLALGYTHRQMVVEAAARGAVIGSIAAVVAAGVAIAASALFPLGGVRALEPHPGVRIDRGVLALGVVALIATASGAAAFGAARGASRTQAPRARRVALADRIADAGAGSSVVHGVRHALSRQRQGRRSIPPIAFTFGIALGLVALVGALVVGTSLDRATDDPPRYGQNYDALFGNPYVPTESDLVAPVLGVAEFRDVTAATTGTLSIERTDVPVYAFESVRGDLGPLITSGRAPAGVDEIALGRRLARQLDRGVGEVVAVDRFDGTTVELRVVGVVVTPDSAGDGAAMTFPGFTELVPDATKNLVLVNLHDGAAADAIERAAAAAATPPGAMVIPPGVNAVARVVDAPFILALVLALFALATLAQNLVSTVRDRRHDLAVLRALGSDGRQLRGIVHAHATTVAVVGAAVAIPVGAVLGGRIFTLVANGVGIVATPLTSALVLGLFLGAVLVVANLVALVPARRAARIETGTQLRRP